MAKSWAIAPLGLSLADLRQEGVGCFSEALVPPMLVAATVASDGAPIALTPR